MTIRISLRVVAFVVLTLALLGGAFGISYAVLEWRSNPEPTYSELKDQYECEAALVAAETNPRQEIQNAIDRYCK